MSGYIRIHVSWTLHHDTSRYTEIQKHDTCILDASWTKVGTSVRGGTHAGYVRDTCRIYAGYMQNTCKIHAGYMYLKRFEDTFRIHAGYIEDKSKIHAG
jgi:hypothetical protein